MVAQGISDNVTTFTMSDFGRTFNPAGTGAIVGSDHAWGNHFFVIGGAVIGGDFYGVNASNGTPFPTLVYQRTRRSDSGIGAADAGFRQLRSNNMPRLWLVGMV